ncbi:MAG: hypothetical protein WCW84_07125 [Sulfurimonas sp.]|jgi:hypothetical protein
MDSYSKDYNDALRSQQLEDKMREQQRREEQARMRADEEEEKRQETLAYARKMGTLKK